MWLSKLLKSRIITSFISVIYLICLLYLVFFAGRRRHLTIRYLKVVPIKNTLKELLTINYLSGKEIFNFYLNLFGNIGLFFPLPIIMMLFYGSRSLKKVFFFSLSISLFVETMQYIFKRGVADVDDVFLNMIGVVLGISYVKLRTA